MTLPALALQGLWLYALFDWLAPWAAALNILLSFVALLIVLFLVATSGEATYKILWLLIILPFPIFGALLYLFYGNRRAGKNLQKQLDNVILPTLRNRHFRPEGLSPRMNQTLTYLESLTGHQLCPNQRTTYYPLGEQLFESMKESLLQAQQYIYLEYFILEPGQMWDQLFQILQQKVKQGVDVRLIFDDFGSISTLSHRDLRKIRDGGIKVLRFNPLFFIKGALNCRDHRKMMIIDGHTAFTGGVNLADEYINATQRFGHWKDIGIQIEGLGAQSYCTMFLKFWNSFSDDPIEELDLPAIPTDQQADGAILSYDDTPIQGKAISNELYIELLAQAERYAYFYTPYLILGDDLLNAFVRAAQRGVDVRLILPGIPDKKLIFKISQSYYPRLIDAGVKIYQYSPGFLHAKGCVIDDQIGTVGTVNLDYRSLFLHFENNTLLINASALNDLKADFLHTQSLCQQQTAQMINRKPIHFFINAFLRLFAPLC